MHVFTCVCMYDCVSMCMIPSPPSCPLYGEPMDCQLPIRWRELSPEVPPPSPRAVLRVASLWIPSCRTDGAKYPRAVPRALPETEEPKFTQCPTQLSGVILRR